MLQPGELVGDKAVGPNNEGDSSSPQMSRERVAKRRVCTTRRLALHQRMTKHHFDSEKGDRRADKGHISRHNFSQFLNGTIRVDGEICRSAEFAGSWNQYGQFSSKLWIALDLSPPHRRIDSVIDDAVRWSNEAKTCSI
jgi:hypothetical protein